MNILFFSNIVTPYQLDFLEELNNQRDAKAFGYFLFPKEENREWDLKVPSYVIVANYSKKISDYKSLYQFIKSNKIDNIIIGGYTLPFTCFLIFLSKLQKKDVYFWLERPMNKQSRIKKFFKFLYLKFILRCAKKIFAIGKLAFEIYKKYNTNVVDLPYSMQLEKFYDIQRDNKNQIINFLFSGQYIDRKNILNTINAFKQVDNKNIRLNIIGGGELKEEVSKLIKDDSRINNLGFVQPHELPEVYANNDIFLMPSKHDGWALVINEAMASAMPIISTNKVGAVCEYIKHKENGYVCNIDVNSIKEGIEYYVTNIEFIESHAKKNRDLAKKSLGDVKNAVMFILKELKR